MSHRRAAFNSTFGRHPVFQPTGKANALDEAPRLYNQKRPFTLNMAPLRLTIEPIPASSRLASLANLLPRDQWDRLRRNVYRRAGYRCQACGREGRLHCHEIWRYNEDTHTQWLAGLLALCPDCHDAKHLMFARNPDDRARLVRHFTTVNRLAPSEADAILQAAEQRQQWLDQRRWGVDYGACNVNIPCLPNTERWQDFLRSSGFRLPAGRVRKSLLASEQDEAWDAETDY